MKKQIRSSESDVIYAASNREAMYNCLAKVMVGFATVVWGILGTGGAFAAMFAVMLFDAPGSEKQLATIVLAVGAMTFPVLCLISLIMSWAAVCDGLLFKACKWTLLPLVSIALGLAAQIWINVFQNGRLCG